MPTNVLSKYEVSRVIGERMRELDNDADPTVSCTTDESTFSIACREFLMGTLCATITRKSPSGYVEEIHVESATLPVDMQRTMESLSSPKARRDR